MEKPEKTVKNIEIFLKMEDRLGKKILDFSGEMVHNGGHPTRLDKRICCKTHMRKRMRDSGGEKAGGMKTASAE